MSTPRNLEELLSRFPSVSYEADVDAAIKADVWASKFAEHLVIAIHSNRQSLKYCLVESQTPHR